MMLGHILSTTFILRGISVVTAQALQVPLTSTCSATLQGLFTAPEARCLNLPSLLSFIVDPNKSVPRTVNLWLTGLCSVGSCNNEAIATIVANVTHGCSEDFLKASIDIVSIQDKVTNIAQEVYPTVRKATLNNVEAAIGKLGPDDLDIDTLNQDIQTFLTSNLTKIACTNCMKSAYTIGRSDFLEQVSRADQPFELLCGASFLDGSTPSNVVVTVNQDKLSTKIVRANSGVLLASISLKWPISAWSLLMLSTVSVFLV